MKSEMAQHAAPLRCLLLLLLLLMMSSIAVSTGSTEMKATCDASDLAALRSFAESFPAGNFSEWEATEDCCAWGASVTCSEPAKSNNVVTRRVTTLSLQTDIRKLNNYPIPPSVCSLSALTTLILAGTHTAVVGLTGSIIPCIGSNLTDLVYLDLSFNTLTGSIPPSFSRLHSLLSLSLSVNHLSGPLLTSSLPSSGRLRSLHLSVNSFSSASFLSSLVTTGHFGNLSELSLYYNYFSGPIPSFNMTPRLSELDLGTNSFSGNLSGLFGSLLPSLTHLDLSHNSLSGEIPINFDPSHFPSLESLNLEDNLLNGSLPPSLCRLSSNLTSLSLSSNAFSGQLLGQCRGPHFTQLLTLGLANNLFTGSPKWIGSLLSLEKLDLSNNLFSGAFPEWIGSLFTLEVLDLSYNRFNGTLPNSWQNLSSLLGLQLSGNSLVPGNVPDAPKLPRWLLTFPRMLFLSLSSMGLTDTDLDCYSNMLLFNVSMRLTLDLSDNRFTSGVLGCLSQYMSSNSPSWRGLNLSGNPLSLNLNHPGAVKLLPSSLGVLHLSSCEISGRLTNLFFDHITPSVTFLSLAHNNLTGEVPAQLGNLSTLLYLDLSHNSFTGFAPLESKLGKIIDLLISNNVLAGNLSTLLLNVLNVSLCDPEKDTLYGPFLELFNLDLSNNFLEGVIPSFLGHCISFEAGRLKLNDNHLEGFLPNELFGVHKYYYLPILSLSNNRFTGRIPPSFKNLRELVLLDLGHNRLQGSLESLAIFSNDSANQYASLRILLLGNNEFTGSIPLSLGQIAPNLQLIDLSNNHLTGPVPISTLQALTAFRVGNRLDIPGLNISVRGTLYEEIRINVKGSELSYEYVLAALTALDLSGNNLSGSIPTGVGELAGLVALNLSRNRLSGQIPGEIGKLAEQLQVLDVSFNELVGPIPPSFHKLTKLAVFNVSYNKGLNGSIPQSQPQFEMPESYIGDPDLCGNPTLRACNTPVPPPLPSQPPHADTNTFAGWIDEWIAIPGLCLGLVVGFFTTLFALNYAKCCTLLRPCCFFEKLT